MTTFAAGNRHFEAYMLRLFPPAMVPIINTQVLPDFFYINLRKNNIFIFDIHSFIRYELKYLKKVIN